MTLPYFTRIGLAITTLLVCLTAVSCGSQSHTVSPSDAVSSHVPVQVSLSDLSMEIGKGITTRLTANGGDDIQWLSSDESVATVAPDGTVTGEGVGTCTVSARNEDGNSAECVVTVKKTCYLTFDDGPNENTPALLAVLKENDVRATFFVVSSYYLEYTKDMQAQGCVVGLHTYSHDYQSCYRSTTSYYYGLERMARRVEAITGTRPNLIRFPGGTHNAVSKPLIMQRVANGAKDLGYRAFDWTATAGDTSEKKASADFSVYCVKRDCTKDVEILLMHEKGFNIQALKTIIPYLREQGYVFETLDKYPEDSFTFPTRYSRKNPQIPSTSVEIGLASANLAVGKSITLTAHMTPGNSTDYPRWECADPTIADVMPDGTVTGLAPGQTDIYAITSSGQRAVCQVTVS